MRFGVDSHDAFYRWKEAALALKRYVAAREAYWVGCLTDESRALPADPVAEAKEAVIAAARWMPAHRQSDALAIALSALAQAEAAARGAGGGNAR